MVSFFVKHLAQEEGPQPSRRMMVSRKTGVEGGKVMASRKHYDIPMEYTVYEENGNQPVTYDANFPSGKYSALDYTPIYEHHRFVEWRTAPYDAEAQGEIKTVDADTTVSLGIKRIYAIWQTPASVTFDATTNGGQMPSDWVAPDYYSGQPYGELPKPTKTGEVFIGWYTANDVRVTASSEVESDSVVLTARYSVVNYATSFEVTTTSSYKKFGIYSTAQTSSPTVVDWGDGETDVISGNISQLVHTFPASSTTYTVRISDTIYSFGLSTNNATWYQTNSNVAYTLKKVLTISPNITSLPSYAFYSCGALTNAMLPSSTSFKTVPTGCFNACSTLANVTIPASVTTINSDAFRNCTSSNFNAITIPANCTTISQYAFYQCYYLKPKFEANTTSTTTFETYCFSYTMYNGTAGTIDLSNRKVTSIPSYCFYYCRYLKHISFPTGLTSIGTYAFRYCWNQSSATGDCDVPEGVTTIGTYAFANTSYLSSITLPSTLASIGNNAFYYATRLATITVNRSTAPGLGTSPFGGSATYYTGRTYYSAGTNRLYVPAGATGYDTGNWLDPLQDSTKCGFTLVEMEEI